MIKDKKILITGGAGFIGSALVDRLSGANSIVIYDNFSRSLGDKAEHYADNFFVIKGDVTDYKLLRELSDIKVFEGVDIIIHCAAIAGIDTVIKHPTKTMEVILSGTMNMLKIARDLKVEQFINFSTSEVFGSFAFQVAESGQTVIGEVGESRWNYAVSKLAAEHLVKAYANEFDVPVTIIRPFNIYGPKQVGEGAIQKFILNAIAGENIEIHGDGTQIRSWCYIDDMADAILLCLNNKQAVREVFNIGNPRATLTILELARKIKAFANSDSEIMHISHPSVDVALRVPNIKKARKLLFFEPKVDLDEGIQKTIEWYKENK